MYVFIHNDMNDMNDMSTENVDVLGTHIVFKEVCLWGDAR